MVSIEAMTEFLPDQQSSHVETQLDPTVRQFVFDFLQD